MSTLSELPLDGYLNKLTLDISAMLFDSEFSSTDAELIECFKYVAQCQQQGTLTVDYLSLYQQRLLACLISLDLGKKRKIGNILALSDVWSLSVAIFNARLDAVTIEVLLKNFENVVKTKSVESIYRIISDVESLSNKVIASHLPRSKRIEEYKYSDMTDTDLVANKTWFKKAIHAQVQLQLNQVVIFNDFSNYQDEGAWQAIGKDSYSFLLTYLKKGVVRNVWIFTSPDIKKQLPPPHQEDCIAFNDLPSDMVIAIQIGNYIWIQTNKFENFGLYHLPANVSDLYKIVQGLIKQDLKYHYLLSRSGLWQYKMSLVLKGDTNFSPKRSDYLK